MLFLSYCKLHEEAVVRVWQAGEDVRGVAGEEDGDLEAELMAGAGLHVRMWGRGKEQSGKSLGAAEGSGNWKVTHDPSAARRSKRLARIYKGDLTADENAGVAA